MLVTGDAAFDVEIEARRQVAGTAAAPAKRSHEEVRLVVGARLLGIQIAGEGDALAVAGEGEIVDRTGDVDDLLRLAAGRRHGPQIAVRALVVLLLDVRRVEDQERAVVRPLRLSLTESAMGDLARLRQRRARGGRYGDGPQMTRTVRIEIARAVVAVDGARDHPHVALVLLVRLLPLLLLLLLRQVLVVRPGGEGDRPAVRRPDRRAGSPDQIGELDRLAAGRRDQPDLASFRGWRARLGGLRLGGALEGDPPAVRRPPGRRVARARGERPSRLARVGGDDP